MTVAAEVVVDVLERQLAGGLTSAQVDRGQSLILLPVGAQRMEVALAPLVTACASLPLVEVERVVRQWWADVVARAGELEATGGVGTVSVAAESLRLRVGLPWADGLSEGFVATQIPDCFQATVVAPDNSFGERFLTALEADAFGGTHEALALAMGNTITRELDALDIRDREVAGFACRVIASDDTTFVPNILMALEHFTPGSPLHGLLVAVPSSHCVVVAPVSNRRELGFARELAGVAATMHASARAPMTPDVFWLRNRRFRHVGLTESGGLLLPPELQTGVDGMPD